MSKSGCSKTIFWLFFILIMVPSGCGIINSIFFPATGRWSTGKSYEKFQTYFPTKYIFPFLPTAIPYGLEIIDLMSSDPETPNSPAIMDIIF